MPSPGIRHSFITYSPPSGHDARQCTALTWANPSLTGDGIAQRNHTGALAMACRPHSRIQSAIAGLYAGFKPLIAMKKSSADASAPSHTPMMWHYHAVIVNYKY
jgi:hypothetical protein